MSVEYWFGWSMGMLGAIIGLVIYHFGFKK